MKAILFASRSFKVAGFTGLLVLLSACTNSIIDEVRHDYVDVAEGESIVVIGRHHKSEYETELDFVRCIGLAISEETDINVIPEQEFIDNLYPWFEPRTAPIRLAGMENLLQRSGVKSQLTEMGIRHIIWIDGSTQVTSKAGSLACGASLTGASCIGYMTWDSEAKYEASIWDFKNHNEAGKVSAEAKGTSYMPAIIVPIPMIARVKTTACAGLGTQLRTFLTAGEVRE